MLRETAEFARARARRPGASARSARATCSALLDQLRASAGGPTFYGGRAGRGGPRAWPTRARADARPRPAGGDFEPVWFSDFAAAAARHGMAYVGERRPGSSRAAARGPTAVDAFVATARGRRPDRARAVLRPARAAALPPLAALPRRARGRARAVDRCGRAAAARAPDGRTAELGAPLRAALEGAGPLQPLACAERSAHGAPRTSSRARSSSVRRRRTSSSTRCPPPAAAESPASGRVASALARCQATPGRGRHDARSTTIVRITDEPTSALLRLLDGTRDRAAIRDGVPRTARPAVTRARALVELRRARAPARVAGASGPGRISSWKCSKSASSVSRPCLPYSCATARTRWRIAIARVRRRRPGRRRPASSCGSRRRRA